MKQKLRMAILFFLILQAMKHFQKYDIRGIKVADIVILVVAADDGVMPQTIEAIKHAKSMNVPIIVAINKIDKVEPPRLKLLKGRLAQHDLLPEEWGGRYYLCANFSKNWARHRSILEMIVLQSQMMELRADTSGMAHGYVLESKLEKGRGPVATILTQHGV